MLLLEEPAGHNSGRPILQGCPPKPAGPILQGCRAAVRQGPNRMHFGKRSRQPCRGSRELQHVQAICGHGLRAGEAHGAAGEESSFSVVCIASIVRSRPRLHRTAVNILRLDKYTANTQYLINIQPWHNQAVNNRPLHTVSHGIFQVVNCDTTRHVDSTTLMRNTTKKIDEL